MDLEIIIPCRINLTQKDKYYVCFTQILDFNVDIGDIDAVESRL